MFYLAIWDWLCPTPWESLTSVDPGLGEGDRINESQAWKNAPSIKEQDLMPC
jgi:hypothetical protein